MEKFFLPKFFANAFYPVIRLRINNGMINKNYPYHLPNTPTGIKAAYSIWALRGK